MLNKQFEIDCVRICVNINNIAIENKSSSIYNSLLGFYENKSIVSRAMIYFTQIPLAKYYSERISYIKKDEHLLSASPHNVSVDRNGIVIVEKGFFLCYMSDMDYYVLGFEILEIRYDPYVDVEIFYKWN